MSLPSNQELPSTNLPDNTNSTIEHTDNLWYYRTDIQLYIFLAFLVVVAGAILILMFCYTPKRLRGRKKKGKKASGPGRKEDAESEIPESERISLKNEVERLLHKGKIAQLNSEQIPVPSSTNTGAKKSNTGAKEIKSKATTDSKLAAHKSKTVTSKGSKVDDKMLTVTKALTVTTIISDDTKDVPPTIPKSKAN